MRSKEIKIFVTVGSTRFDALIKNLLENLNVLERLPINRLILQVGESEFDESLLQNSKLQIDVYRYKSSIMEDIELADVVVGHAGAGTCLEVLRSRKKLLVVINESLMDNHQSELADKLSSENYLMKTNVSECIDKLEIISNHIFKQFPQMSESKFEEIFDRLLSVEDHTKRSTVHNE